MPLNCVSCQKPLTHVSEDYNICLNVECPNVYITDDNGGQKGLDFKTISSDFNGLYEDLAKKYPKTIGKRII